MNTYRLIKNTDSVLYDDEIGFLLLPLLISLDVILLPLQPLMYIAIKYMEKQKIKKVERI